MKGLSLSVTPVVLLAAAACVFDPQVPGGVRLDCISNADCPPLFVCRAGAGVCVEAALGAPRCGDAIVDVGEACDDGNARDGDACTNACTLPTCGDEVAQAPEECDDGNASNGDGCTNACLLPRCGDGFLQVGEECDDANTANDDGCVACATARCGDGVVLLGFESCDDGNNAGGDGCSADCRKVEVCGDGALDVGEDCDDGNGNENDACHACQMTSWASEVVTGLGPAGGDPTETGIGRVAGVAVDLHGNIFFSEQQRVWKIDPSGRLSVVAGNGTFGFGGDGGPATSAGLSGPAGLAVDGLGNLFIADQFNGRIRRVAADGTISTVVGGANGSLEDGNPATSGRLSSPTDVAVDGVGSLFISETVRIRKVVGGIISTVAGNGTAGFSGDGGPATNGAIFFPKSVAVDTAGNLYIADTSNNRIRKVSTDGTLSTVAGNGTADFSGDGGPATAASLSSPRAVVVDGDGNLFIADAGRRRIRKVATDGTISTIAGDGTPGFSGDGGPATEGSLDSPVDVAVDTSGRLFIADEGNRRIRQVAADGTLSTLAGNGTLALSGDGGQATASSLQNLSGVAVDSLGNFFFAETQNNRVRQVAADGTISTVAGNGTPGSSGDGGPATAASLDSPRGVAVDADGNLFIAENRRIRRVAPGGTISTVAGNGVGGFSGDGGPATAASLSPFHIAVDGAGNLFFADPWSHRIRKIALDGTISTVAGNGGFGFSGDGGPATAASLHSPSAVAVDGVGNLYIADNNNSRIRKVVEGGTISTIAGNGDSGFSGDGGPAAAATFNAPSGVVVDGDGNLFITDQVNHRIRKVTPDGTISTVAGNGDQAFAGDGGLATDAALSDPAHAAVDGGGNLLILDAGNARIRKVTTTGTISTVAGGAEPGGPFAVALLPAPTALAVVGDGLAIASQAHVLFARLEAARIDVAAGYEGGGEAASSASRFSRLLEGVAGVAFDSVGSVIYLAERENHSLRAIDVVDPEDVLTWTIRTVGGLEGVPGFVDHVSFVDARFDSPTGLAFDEGARTLYVADTGNHVVRAVDVDGDLVTTVAGTPRTLGFFGDDGDARSALLLGPRAVAVDTHGHLFIADTDNHRVRRVDSLGVITTVIGDGTPASSGVGAPARLFPVATPLGVATDRFDNLYVTSTVSVRQVMAGPDGAVSGDDEVRTIYGQPPFAEFPENLTRCLTGVVIGPGDIAYVADGCAGLLLGLHRTP